MKAVILAGGFGKRMGDISKSIPKPMTLIAGKPVLEHQIDVLKKEGVKEFIFVVGHLYGKIEEYFGDGKRFEVSITYYRETEPLGTAGALFKMNFNDDFLLCNGDLIFNFDLKKMSEFHRKKGSLATLFTHPNSHPYDSTLVVSDENDCVTGLASDKDRTGNYQNLCNAGIQIISPELLKMYDIEGKANLDRDVIMPAIKTGRIFSYKSFEYAKDMGTPERLKAVEEDMLKGTVKSRHSDVLQKAVFIDRDGTVNIHRGFITEPEEIELISGAGEAIKKINKLGYLAIIVTNQPVIARGECSEEKLRVIHNRLETLLGEKGAYVDGIYHCPHHPDKGFPGERTELKFNCECRKPAPGLLLKAKEDFNIDMPSSFVAGDSISDVEAGKNAGCVPVFLSKEKSGEDDKNWLVFESLFSFSEYLETLS